MARTKPRPVAIHAPLVTRGLNTLNLSIDVITPDVRRPKVFEEVDQVTNGMSGLAERYSGQSPLKQGMHSDFITIVVVASHISGSGCS